MREAAGVAESLSADRLRVYLSCALLAIGQFAFVTSVWMLTGVLRPIADEFGVSLGVAGQVLSVFSITYAVSAPFLAVATARFDRRVVLTGTLAIFVAANLLSVAAQSFGMLIVWRIVAAAADGLFAATATAVVVALASPETRGRTLAIFHTGTMSALFAGVPLSTTIALTFGWNGPFVGVAVIATVAILGLLFFLPRLATPPVAGLRERVEVIQVPQVLPLMFVAILSYLGMFSVYSFLAPILAETAGARPADMSFVFLAFGLGALTGSWLGGWATDRWNATRCLVVSFATAVGLLAVLPFFAISVDRAAVLVFLWGAAHFFGLPPLQLYLSAITSKRAGIALALFNSCAYLGVAIGAVVGGIFIDNFPLVTLGVMGALFKLSALVLFIWTSRSQRRAMA